MDTFSPWTLFCVQRGRGTGCFTVLIHCSHVSFSCRHDTSVDFCSLSVWKHPYVQLFTVCFELRFRSVWTNVYPSPLVLSAKDQTFTRLHYLSHFQHWAKAKLSFDFAASQYEQHIEVPNGLFRQSLSWTGNGNWNLTNIISTLSHCNWSGNWNLTGTT